jgi:hypothetical protein
MNYTVPEPDESGEKCIHCEQPIGDWGDSGMWVHTEEEQHDPSTHGRKEDV